MIELTDPLLKALDNNRDEPLKVVDPRTKQAYVLLRDDLYEQLMGLLDEEEINMRQVGMLVERNMSEYDAGDPSLESYQKDREG